MDAQDKFPQKISTAIIVSLMILFFISTKITVLPVIFTHFVIKLSGICDFKTHNHIIKASEYPEEFFSNKIWSKKVVKTGEYYAVRAVSIFTTYQFSFLCPEEIIKSYRESRKFNPLDTEFDTDVMLKL